MCGDGKSAREVCEMKYIDIIVNILALISGIVTAILGLLLYLKYRINAIKYYAVFIFTITLTVASTTIQSYAAYGVGIDSASLWHLVGFVFFEFYLICIMYSFARFSRGIVHRPFARYQKIMTGVSCLFFILSVIILCAANIGRDAITVPKPVYACFAVILALLFAMFVIGSVQIAVNLKKISNPDLRRALKLLALVMIVFIPLQTVLIILNGQWVYIMLSRNLLYLSIHIISILFAAKYFFIQAPSIMDTITVSASFVNKYAITNREKEVIGLLLRGLSIKEVAAKMDRSFKTVNNHIYNIYQKTGAGNKIELLNLVKENRK